MKPRLINRSAKKIIGIQSMMQPHQHGNIVALWQRFMPRKKEILTVVNKDHIAMQVYSDFNTLEKSFDIWACVEVSSLDRIPKGMTGFIIPKGAYAVFLQKGMDASNTYQQIMTQWLPNSGFEIDDRPHFQVMGKLYKNGSAASEEDFYIPIRLATK
jgi:AraC family transcriptional regulator